MDYNTVAVLHQTDPAIAALRKEWLPLAVSFLHQAFKTKHLVLLPYDSFKEQFETYLDYVNATLHEDDQFRASADDYINRWSREDDLIRIQARDEGYIVQLSPSAERIIGWFDAMQNKEMIGTESRLRNIVALLDEVVTQSTEDVETRLRQLYERRDELDAEIAHIEATHEVEGLSDVQIRERLNNISELANQLLRDFSRVEDRFRNMARHIQQAQLDPAARRGDILGTALDADEQLENSDEGQSFRAFYEILTHPEQRATFDALITAVYDTSRLSTFVEDNRTLQRLTSHLLDSGERVNQSNQRLAEHLRRVVDTRNVTESRRVQALAREIKHVVGQLDERHLSDWVRQRRPFMYIEGDPAIDLPLERPLYDPPEQIIATERPRTASTMVDAEALVALYDTFYIDQDLLQDNITRALMSHHEITLAQLVNSYPITQGMAEVVAYLVIAAKDAHHAIDRTQYDAITITTESDNTPREIIVPRIIFRRQPQLEATHV
jgi:hypothetical protein